MFTSCNVFIPVYKELDEQKRRESLVYTIKFFAFAISSALFNNFQKRFRKVFES